MSLLIAAILCVFGWALFATSQRGQRRRLGAAPLTRASVIVRRGAGLVMLAAGLVGAVVGLGFSLGVVFWFAALGCIGLALSVALGFVAYRRNPR